MGSASTIDASLQSDRSVDRVPESEIVRGCKNGNRESQRHLYELHGHSIYRLMCRMLGKTDAEDLTQQVFLRAFLSIDRFAGRSALATWLYRLAINEALQFLRQKKRKQFYPVLSEPVTNTNSIKTVDDREVLNYALERIDPDLRAIFVLREIEHLSYHDIALALDIAEGTVASRLNRARRVLRELLIQGGAGNEDTSGALR